MTSLLEKAIGTITLESQELQDWIAALILEEILHEKKWLTAFSSSPAKLENLAKSALLEIEADEFEEGGFDNL